MVSKMLAHLGYDVMAAMNAEKALEMFIRYGQSFDILITDVIMPGISGMELADQFLKYNATLKVLFVSGYTGDELAYHGILSESVLFLQKPFSPQTLVEKVHEILEMDRPFSRG